MAYLVNIEWKGATADEYDRVCENGNVGAMTDPSEGAIAHFASVDDDGLHVVDVWESPEQFEAFVANRLPAIAEAGVDRPPPTAEMREIHAAKVFAPAAVA